MRGAFVNGLVKVADKNNKVMLLTGDLGYRFLEKFKDKFPDRFINVGVAESNLVTVAGGLSTCGFVPFIYSISTFASMRAYEQIRNVIGLQNLNVIIVGIGAGLAYSKAGSTHHSYEDIALMRSIPNMTIVAPASKDQCFQATRALVRSKGPAYLRIEYNAKTETDFEKSFEIGRAYTLKRGRKIAIFVTGTKTDLALEAAELLKKSNINPTIACFPTISPLDKAFLRNIAKNHKNIATIEEHGKIGGFGSAISEYMNDINMIKKPQIINFSLQASKMSSFSTGTYDFLKFSHGLTADNIAKTIVRKIKQKKSIHG